jgi:hypothetical protein
LRKIGWPFNARIGPTPACIGHFDRQIKSLHAMSFYSVFTQADESSFDTKEKQKSFQQK